jgi:hypothetical protein
LNASAALEHGTTGLWYGRIIEFIGTHARSETRAQLLCDLSDELLYNLKWLESHGEPVRGVAPKELEVKEEITGVGDLGESGGEVALFQFDIRPVSANSVNRMLRHMEFNREDLLTLCEHLGSEQMRLVPPGKGRSIEGILAHICNAEEFYISRMGADADRLYETRLGMPVAEADEIPVFERLRVVRAACVGTLRELVPDLHDSVFTRTKYSKYPEEQWTAHKVMRRFLEHEREHIYNIREYLELPIRHLA